MKSSIGVRAKVGKALFVNDMPRKSQRPSWIERYGVNLTTLGVVFFTAIGFYFSTINTLNEHSKALEELKTVNKNELKEREKIRSDFITNSEKTAAGIATLNTKTEIQNVQLQEIGKSLDKINRTLETVTVQRR